MFMIFLDRHFIRGFIFFSYIHMAVLLQDHYDKDELVFDFKAESRQMIRVAALIEAQDLTHGLPNQTIEKLERNQVVYVNGVGMAYVMQEGNPPQIRYFSSISIPHIRLPNGDTYAVDPTTHRVSNVCKSSLFFEKSNTHQSTNQERSYSSPLPQVTSIPLSTDSAREQMVHSLEILPFAYGKPSSYTTTVTDDQGVYQQLTTINWRTSEAHNEQWLAVLVSETFVQVVNPKVPSGTRFKHDEFKQLVTLLESIM